MLFDISTCLFYVSESRSTADGAAYIVNAIEFWEPVFFTPNLQLYLPSTTPVEFTVIESPYLRHLREAWISDRHWLGNSGQVLTEMTCAPVIRRALSDENLVGGFLCSRGGLRASRMQVRCSLLDSSVYPFVVAEGCEAAADDHEGRAYEDRLKQKPLQLAVAYPVELKAGRQEAFGILDLNALDVMAGQGGGSLTLLAGRKWPVACDRMELLVHERLIGYVEPLGR